MRRFGIKDEAESRFFIAVCKWRERVRGDSVLEKDGGGGVEAFADARDVSFFEGAFFVEDLGDVAFGADVGHEIFLTKVVGFHQSAKNFNGGGIGNGMMLLFLRFDEGEKDRDILLFLGKGMLLGSEREMEERFLSTRADRFAGAKREEKVDSPRSK